MSSIKSSAPTNYFWMVNDLTKNKVLRVSWLTNVPAPYRIPIWDSFSKSVDLRVFFLFREKNWRNWSFEGRERWKISYLSKPSIRYREIDFTIGVFGAKKLVEKTDLIIIGGWDAPFYLFTLLQAKRANIPTILFYESTLQSHRFNGRLIRFIRSRIFQMADYVLTVGTASTEATLDIGVDPTKILTLFNPVDVRMFAEFSSFHRRESATGHRFLYVGRLISLKNVAALIDAFASARKDGDSLTIVGDGVLMDDLKKQVENLGLESFVHFAGHHNQQQISQDYASADTLVLPSTNEVWGLVVNEALASGLHVIVSDAAGVSQFVEPMKGVYVCQPTTSEIAIALERSRSDWLGPVSNPEILEYTPERFADGLLKLANSLMAYQNNRGLLWITNIPAPYRVPIWKALDSKYNFNLSYFNKTEKGRSWNLSEEMRGLKSIDLNLHKFYIPFNPTAVYLNWWKVWNEVKKVNPQAIYFDGYESPAFFISAFLARKRNIQVVFGYRSTLQSHRFNGRLIRFIRSRIFQMADYVLTVGTASTEATLDIGVDPTKILTLFNPVDVRMFAEFSSFHRRESATGHRFLYVGRLISLKNVAALIDAFASARKDGDSLTIVGDGVLMDDLKKQVENLGLESFVHFAGHHNQQQISQDYASADTLVLPSTNEVWGLVVNEALASGLHVIVSDAAGVSQFVEPMKGVYVCQPTTSEIAIALERSRSDWLGPVSNPEILEYTPERFADGLLKLISWSN